MLYTRYRIMAELSAITPLSSAVIQRQAVAWDRGVCHQVHPLGT